MYSDLNLNFFFLVATRMFIYTKSVYTSTTSGRREHSLEVPRPTKSLIYDTDTKVGHELYTIKRCCW